MTRRNLRGGALFAPALLALMVGSARAQVGTAAPAANIEGLTVTGRGTASAKPDRLEIDLEISAASEISSDVIVKYRDAKKRLQGAFAALKLKNVTVQEKALTVDQKGQMYNPYMMDMPPARKGKVEVQLRRKLVVSCTGIRELDEEALLQLVAKLLDVAQDAGGKVGGGSEYNPYYGRYNASSGMVRFVLDDFESIQEKAYQAAIDDARKRATRLAGLSGRQLGPVAGVREVLIPGDKPSNNQTYMYDAGTNAGEEEPWRKRLESPRFQEIPVRVELQVRFDLGPPGGKAENAGGGR